MTVKDIIGLLPNDHPFRLEIDDFWGELVFIISRKRNLLKNDY